MPETNPAPATQSVIVQPNPAPSAPLASALQTVGAYAASIAAIATLVILLVKFLTREVGRDVSKVERDVVEVRKTADQAAADIRKLTADRASDVERIVRLETAIPAIKETTGRIEQTLDRNFSELASSIREMRIVTPRG